jgi:hypothetical protein
MDVLSNTCLQIYSFYLKVCIHTFIDGENATIKYVYANILILFKSMCPYFIDGENATYTLQTTWLDLKEKSPTREKLTASRNPRE